MYFVSMRRLIIIGGAAPERIKLDRSIYSAVIAADSGYDTARRLGIEITDAVGDFDSTAYRQELIAMGYVPCSHDKDESDTELAIRKGDGPYDLIGGGEGRLDHTLALLALMSRADAPRRWFTARDAITAISRPMRIAFPAGRSVSFFSFKGTVKASTHGLVWELDGFPVSLSSVSLSNRTEDGSFDIYPDGELMMRTDLEDYPLTSFADIPG